MRPLRSIDRVEIEAEIASSRYGPFHSTHEGLGVLIEEVHELVEAIRNNDRAQIEREAIQVSAVAIRIADSLGDIATCKRSNVAAPGDQ